MTALTLKEMTGTYPLYPTIYKPLIDPTHWPAILIALLEKKYSPTPGKVLNCIVFVLHPADQRCQPRPCWFS